MRDGWIVWRVGGEAVTRRRAETRDGGLRLWLQSALRAGRKSLRWLKLFQSDPSREASNLTGRSNCESVKPRNLEPTRNGSWGFGSVEPVRVWRRPCRHRKLGRRDVELPGVGEDGMSGRNVQRKLGTTRGSPRRSRTAKTSRISRHAVKSRCACEWGGWGRLSDDGSRQHNSGRSEDPWGSGNPTLWRCTIESASRLWAGQPLDHEVYEGWMQTKRHGAYVGSRLKRSCRSGRRHLKC